MDAKVSPPVTRCHVPHADSSQPQRPRAVRVHDENALPTQPIATKTIHQRNKSTPALSMLMQGGAVRGGIKRSAFADVSNTQRTVGPAKDDSAIDGKSLDKPVSHVPELVKPIVLSRPAQRPIAVKATSTQAVTTTTSIIVPTKPAAPEIAPIQTQAAAARRVQPHRSTAVLKDVSCKEAEVSTITSSEVEAEKHSGTEAQLAQLKESPEEQSPVIDGVILPYTDPKKSEARPPLVLSRQAQPSRCPALCILLPAHLSRSRFCSHCSNNSNISSSNKLSTSKQRMRTKTRSYLWPRNTTTMTTRMKGCTTTKQQHAH